MASKYLKNLEVGEWFVRTAPNYVLQIKKTWETKGGKIDMRSALGEIYEDGVAIGEKRGEERGITIGEKRSPNRRETRNYNREGIWNLQYAGAITGIRLL